MTQSKNTLFCTKCGNKNNSSSSYCSNCGTKLTKSKKPTKDEIEKNRELDKKLNQVTLKNMSSKISGATFLVARVIVKSSIITFRPKQPTTHDSYSTRAFIVLEGTLRYSSDVTDEVKKKLLEDLGTDMDIKQVEWGTFSSISFGLRNKGWNAISCSGAQWYIWPANGSTVKSITTLDYVNGIPNTNVVKGTTYSQEDIKHDQTTETAWAIVGFIILVIIIIFLATMH